MQTNNNEKQKKVFDQYQLNIPNTFEEDFWRAANLILSRSFVSLLILNKQKVLPLHSLRVHITSKLNIAAILGSNYMSTKSV